MRSATSPSRRRAAPARWLAPRRRSSPRAGVALTLQGWPSRDGFALLLGPTLVVVGLAPLGARLLPASTSYSIGALLVVVWGASLFALVPESTKGASVMLYVVQGIVLTTAAVTLVSFQQERLSRALRFVTGGRSLSLRLGLAYPLARRSRTGLTIAMYALVVFILTFITSLAHMIDSEVDTATKHVQGGYSVIVSSSPSNPVSPSSAVASSTASRTSRRWRARQGSSG